MKGVAQAKVGTSGRLAGKAKAQPPQSQLVPNPRLDPAYSLYSLDAQKQVTSLHKGLDRCAALLSGILQEDQSGDVGEAKDEAFKPKLPPSLEKKIVKKAPGKTDRKSCHSAHRRPGSTTPRPTHHPAVPAAHSGVKLHPTRKRFQTAVSQLRTPHRKPSRSLHQTPPTPASPCRVEGERGGEDFIPVRDVSPCVGSSKVSEMQHEGQRAEGGNEARCAEGEVKMQSVQGLLRDLKALITREGSVAETLFCHLEQLLSSPLVSAGNPSVQSEADVSSLQSQNLQLRRQVEELQQQLRLKESTEKEKVDKLWSSEVCVMKEELNVALSQLQELQDNLTDLRKAHQDMQNQLRDKVAINALIVSDLEATRSRLLDSEREKSEMATLYLQRLEEFEDLKRALQGHLSSDCHVGNSVSNVQHQHKPDASEVASERVTHYLRSLMQPGATAKERTPQKSPTTVPRGGQAAENTGRSNPFLPLELADKDLPGGPLSTSVLSQCDVESLCSDWSMRSGSTFNTKDEAAFRDGLSALDASIANLMKTLQLDREKSCT